MVGRSIFNDIAQDSHRGRESGRLGPGLPVAAIRERLPGGRRATTLRIDLVRSLDILLATVGLILVAPTLALLAAAIRLQDGGPALFRQARLGRDGVEFLCLKLRTMRTDASARLDQLLASDPAAQAEWARDQKLRCDPRITPLGRFLRASSLDELPQLINVLRGEMSLVGPRPIVAAEIERYGRQYRHYCAVRPGLTGLWQISGRNEVSYDRRVAMDVLYVKNRTIVKYFQILILTVPAVLFKRGSY